MKSNRDKVAELGEKKSRILQMGGAARVEAQHKANELTVRERISRLFDLGSFNELDMLVKHRCVLFDMDKVEVPADAVVIGFGEVEGRTAYIAAQDYTTFAGTYSEMHGREFCKAIDMAYAARVPFIQMIDSGGARLQGGQDSSEWYALFFRRHTLYNGILP